ncbi:MAG TPA: PRC-barrel domain-containing protein [Allosphingosinicella sp.]|nr:PRC-barrel domain-containing protein [Allosphingosinicella sp.]
MERNTYDSDRNFEALEDLDKWQLQDDDQDIRGRMLVSATGDSIGRIDKLLVDREHERVAAVRLADGRTFPVEPLLRKDDVVVLLGETATAEEKRESDAPKSSAKLIRVRPRVPEPVAHVPPAPAPERKAHWNWNKIGVGVAVLGAAAGAALLSRKGGNEDDFEFRLETDENVRLISSTKVEGTPVLDRDGAKIGKIENFMVDKYTGRVAYAVMSFGGMMGLGTSLFPLPWPLLEYDESKGGYKLGITKEEMKDAPRFEPSDTPEFDADYRKRVLLFYRGA